MLKQGIKADSKENEVKHIKKVAPQPEKSASPKPQVTPPRTASGCIPVGD